MARLALCSLIGGILLLVAYLAYRSMYSGGPPVGQELSVVADVSLVREGFGSMGSGSRGTSNPTGAKHVRAHGRSSKALMQSFWPSLPGGMEFSTEMPPGDYTLEAGTQGRLLPDADRTIQRALELAFELKVQKQTLSRSVWLLTAPKKLGDAFVPIASGARQMVHFTSTSPGPATGKFEGSFEMLANWLGAQLEMPVLDSTGIDGSFAITLQWSIGQDAKDWLASEGFGLTPATRPIDTWVVTANRKPTSPDATD